MSEDPKPSYVAATWDGDPPSLLISTIATTHLFFHTCPHAQTYEAYSAKLRCTVWIPLPCKQWSCRFCAITKVRLLARKCEDAKPNRLLTLTVDPNPWERPRDAFDGTRRKVSELCRKLRNRFGELEYLRVTELTRRGWPHYHMLVRSGFLPQPVVKDLWCELTKAKIVDLRRVKDRFQTYTYLVKYLTKMHTLEWTDRHVSYSKGFFPAKPKPKPDKYDLKEGKVLETHPANLVFHQFRNSELVEIGYNIFTLNPSEQVIREVSDRNPHDANKKELEKCLRSQTKNSFPKSSQKLLPLSSSG